MDTSKDLLSIPPGKLGNGTGIPVTVVRDNDQLSSHFARTMVDEIRKNNEIKRPTNFILPVGPKGQYKIFVEIVLKEDIDLGRVSLFFMDEYLNENNRYIPISHPLSFRGFIRDALISPLQGKTGLDIERVYFPDPEDPGKYSGLMIDAGGVDVSFAGVGINGHIAFNEPPEPGVDIPSEVFRKLKTRNVTLSRETRTINSVTAAGGAIDFIPKRAITTGMKEILGAKRIMVYMNRPWNKAVVRKMLHGEITSSFPASLIRGHEDAHVIVTEEVAEFPIQSLNQEGQ